jgi:hypothetical protein
MTFEEYLKLDAVNFSTLKEMRKSPLHYHYRLHNPREDSTRLAVGRAAHTAILEPDRFLLDYALFSGAIRRGKEWDACCAANKGKTILKGDEYATCLSMRDAVRDHPVAGPLLAAKGTAEQTITWVDEMTGLACKARVDRLNAAPPVLLDVKTTFDVEADRFAATCARMGHHIQLAFYSRGLRANAIDPQVKILAVEATEPHEVAVYALDEDVLFAGDEEIDDLLAKVAAGKFSGLWPGRYTEEQTLSLPGWAFNDEQDVDGLGLVFAAQETT